MKNQRCCICWPKDIRRFSCVADKKGTLTSHQFRSGGTHRVVPFAGKLPGQSWTPGLCSLEIERQMSAGIKEWSAARLAVVVKSMVHKRPVWPLVSKTKHARSCKLFGDTYCFLCILNPQRAGGCTPLRRACLWLGAQSFTIWWKHVQA